MSFYLKTGSSAGWASSDLGVSSIKKSSPVDEAASINEIESKVAVSHAIGLVDSSAVIMAKQRQGGFFDTEQSNEGDLSQNGRATLATISTTHYLLSTSSKQRKNYIILYTNITYFLTDCKVYYIILLMVYYNVQFLNQ